MRTLLLVLVPLVLAGCGDLLSVKAHAKEVCVHRAGQVLPGTGAISATPISGSISDTFPLDLGDVSDLTKNGVAASLDLQSFQLKAGDGVLAGLERLEVRLTPPAGSTLAPLTLVDYAAGAAATPGLDAPVVIAGDTVTVNLAALQADLLTYATGGKLDVEVEASGVLPVSAWQADVVVCAAADATYDYGSKL